MQDCFVPIFDKIILLGASQKVFSQRGSRGLPDIYLVLALPSHFQHQKAFPDQPGDIISPVCCRSKFNFYQRLLDLWSVMKGFPRRTQQDVNGTFHPICEAWRGKSPGLGTLCFSKTWPAHHYCVLVGFPGGGTAQVNPTEVLLKQAVHARNQNTAEVPMSKVASPKMLRPCHELATHPGVRTARERLGLRYLKNLFQV